LRESELEVTINSGSTALVRIRKRRTANFAAIPAQTTVRRLRIQKNHGLLDPRMPLSITV
jgi:hypothetical protein